MIRKERALLKVFGGDKKVLKRYNQLRREAEKEGSPIPDDMAFIRLRQEYEETESGWMKR